MDQRHELAQTLLRKATDDLTMAQRLAGDAQSPDWGIGFHVQQAIEKSLKAVLCARGIEFPRTHSISVLLDLLPAELPGLPMAGAELAILTPYGVLFRYDEAGPTEDELAGLPDRTSLLAMADVIVRWASAATGA